MVEVALSPNTLLKFPGCSWDSPYLSWASAEPFSTLMRSLTIRVASNPVDAETSRVHKGTNCATP